MADSTEERKQSSPTPFLVPTPEIPETPDAQPPSSELTSILCNPQLLQQIRDHILSKEERLSGRSRATRSSRQSSRFSGVSVKATLAAEAAALKARLEFADVEGKQRAEVERQQAELKKIQTLTDLHETEARLKAIEQSEREEYAEIVIDAVKETDSKTSLVEEYIKSLPTPNATHGADESAVKSVSPVGTPEIPQPDQDSSTSQQQIKNELRTPSPQTTLQDLTKTFAEQINLSRLPTPEPGVFTADPLKYPRWKRAFEILIEQRGIPRSERLHYLQKYLGGAVKESIEGYFFLSTDDAFDKAKELLEKRFGDPFVVANAFRNKLESWPKISPRDGTGMRNLADFLGQCQVAMETIGSLQVLDDERENRKVLVKLPDWLINKWARKAVEFKEKQKKYPPFSDFVKFMQLEAKIACDPVTSIQGLRGQDRQNDKGERKRTPGGSSFSTSANEATKNSNTGRGIQNPKSCLLCSKNHNLGDCWEFLKQPLEERKTFAMKKGLCFGCLSQGHMSKHCKRRATCKTCAKSHPTALHGDIRKTEKPTEGGKNPQQNSEKQQTSVSSHTGVSHLSGTSNCCKSSMIVPVWVSHRDKPEKERLVYALLDTQSDTTFILDSTCEALDLQGTKVNLLLSTMFAEDQKVASRKIDGLIVRGFDSHLKISLPAAYSREIMPANRSHIPTSEMARKWPHLEKLADLLMPSTDCEVGILIGYNCPRALAPCDVVPPVNNGPYGQRTVLGWGIVGIVDPNQCEVDDCDPIGVSHRILIHEVPSFLTVGESPKGCTEENVDNIQFSFRSRVKEMVSPYEVAQMMELDFSERKSDEIALSQDDRKFLTKMEEGIHQRCDSHFVMPLPFKEAEPKLPNNKIQALQRLKQLKGRFKKNPQYHSEYNAFMNNIIKSGYAQKVPDSELDVSDDCVWYIPHHGVYRPKKPEKIRVVFDCSAKFEGKSLNDYLLQGPDLTNTLVGVLCRFRQQPIAFMCDIEQMFYQFYVIPDHRKFLRFLWWEKGDPEAEPKEFQMNVHLFGAASSPGCANFGLKQIANSYEEECGSAAANFVRNDFYVDDGLRSVSTSEEAIELITKTKDLCGRGGLRLHKFVSNSREVMEAVSPQDRAKGIKDLDLRHDSLPIERALGVHWCIESDTFQFRIILKDQPLTRRGILSTISSVYDPLGFVSPVLLVGKQILQELCRNQAEWDDPLPESLRPTWERWRSDLALLENFKMRRCFLPENFGRVESVEIHHFSDASTTGYAQCSYLRLTDDQRRVHCSLIMGKCRVCPLKPVSVPRLELTAAVVSVRVSALLQKELEYENVYEVFWTDSRVVLGYIANDARRFHVFVANRVQRIRDHTKPSQWRHVATDVNPADDGSRGLGVEELMNKSRWLVGPNFLWEEQVPITLEASSPTISPEDPEVKKVKSLATQTAKQTFELERLERFSEWHQAKRAIATCLKFKSLLMKRSIKKPQPNSIQALRKDAIPLYKPVMVEDMCQAELEILRLVQKEAFAEEIKILQSFKVNSDNPSRSKVRERNKVMKTKSCLYKLDPFLDADNILRVGGRIRRAGFPSNFKHPAVLPRKHHITELIIRHCHQQTQHQGRGMTVNQIRMNGFWIIGCSSAVSYYISKCVRCRKLFGQVQEQKMADLPEDRLEPAPPFTNCGVDFFGPWYIKEGRKELKRYGVLFTCMATRAIHIETAASLSSDSFINAVRRFISIRGPIRQLRSDRGTNFIGAESELKEAVAEMDHSSARQFLLKEGCDYSHYEVKMKAPSASHTGGAWERQIRSVRRVLGPLMHQAGSQLDDESLRTLMCEAAAIVNSRPLTVDNLNDPTSLAPLTPNHLLTMKSTIILPPPGRFQRTDIYSRKRWRRVQYMTNEFWSRWRKEFIQNLQLRQKWIRPQDDLHIGDIVIIKDENLPRNQWLLARIAQVFPGEDNHVRRVKLAIGDPHLDDKGKRVHSEKFLERPIQKLVLLVEDLETRGIPDEEP
ncbi:uncharacterized protein LOC119727951 [Patiria miniata]|uniref:Integrase catalytic domain-containing protein n=1 Tax=Patiria miniata TaxID=46514 RepID=A0A913ZY28_PATMI|nr:uncharacterized protein LOC119727951 [Patiria miniata]